MMRDEVRETLDKFDDIVKDLMNDHDRWKRRTKTYQYLCRGLLVANVAMVGSYMVQRRMKK